MGTIREIASVTSKGQITLPKSIRQLLGVEAGDRVAFDVQDARVVVSRAEDKPHSDPAIGCFLVLLEQDIREGKHIGTLPGSLVDSMTAAAASQRGESLDEDIEGDVAL